MPKISTYPSVTPTSEDYLVGTDASNLLMTQSFKVGQITALLTLDEVLSNGNTSAEDIVLNGNVTIGAGLTDSLDSVGTSGQVLTSTGSAVEWQDASGGGSLVMTLEGASSDSLQVPSGVDNPMLVNFGAAQGVITDPVSISAGGVVTFNDAGQYHVNVELSVYRSAASSSLSYSLVRGLLNSVTEIEPPTTIGLTNEQYFPYKKTFIIDAVAADTLEIQFQRDSSGYNIGYLQRFLGAGGWGQSRSAYIKIWKA
jgi:hypothetical protein